MAKFERWHKSSACETVNKHDLVIEYAGKTFCSSLLIRSDNPFSKKAEEELIKLKERIEKPL